MICDKRTSIVLPFSESKMFPRGEERESERQMEDRELENICKSSIYSKVGEGREIQFSWRKSTRPGRNSKSFNPPPSPPAVCRFNRGGCRFNETIESRFSAEKWATREDEKFTRSRMLPPIPLLDKFSFFFFNESRRARCLEDRVHTVRLSSFSQSILRYFPRFFFNSSPISSDL